MPEKVEFIVVTGRLMVKNISQEPLDIELDLRAEGSAHLTLSNVPADHARDLCAVTSGFVFTLYLHKTIQALNTNSVPTQLVLTQGDVTVQSKNPVMQNQRFNIGTVACRKPIAE